MATTIPRSIGAVGSSFGRIALMAAAVPTLFAITKRIALDNTIGELSCPFYIYHVLVNDVVMFTLIRLHIIAHMSQLSVVIVFVVTIVIS